MRSVCVFAGASHGTRADYHRATAALGALLARHGCRLIYGGGAAGGMRTLFEAVTEAGGSATGVIPRELAEHPEHGERAETRLADVRITDSRHAQKALMGELSDAVIAVPGGLGTLEDGAGIGSWPQLRLPTTPAPLLNTAGSFDGLITLLDRAVEDGFLDTNARSSIIVERDPVVLLERLLPALDRRLPTPGVS